MWRQVPLAGVPRKFRKLIPVYEVIKHHALELPDEALEVQRVFSVYYGDFLRVYYKGKEYLEEITIAGSQITDAQTTLIAKLVDLPPFGLPEEEFLDRMAEFFSQSKAHPKVKTYHNIKRLEHHFRELPWQSDFSAIYLGDGIFHSTVQ